MSEIENRTFDEIRVGDSVSLSRTLTKQDIELFAVMSGDVNPIHVDEAFARDDMFHKIIAHGMWGGTLISTLLGTELPGPGTIYRSQTLNFRNPVVLGDTVVVTVIVREKNAAKRDVILDCRVVNQTGKVVTAWPPLLLRPRRYSEPASSCRKSGLRSLGVVTGSS
ncbi:MAG: MaoC/PaaZ C-terminal domain-containing protein [Steroidobacteraceae bacterium]